MIRELMRRLGVTRASRVVKVGDTPADLEEGKNAGCGRIVGVTSGTHSRQELAGSPHTHLIESIRDLPAVLGLMGAPTGAERQPGDRSSAIPRSGAKRSAPHSGGFCDGFLGLIRP